MAWSLMERMSPDDLAKLRASLPPGDNQTAANIARSVDPNDPTMAGFGIEHPADVEAPGPPPPDKGPSLDDLNRALTNAAHARAAAHAIAAWQRTNPEARPDEEKIAEGLSAPLQGVLARQRFVGEQGKQATGEMERQHLGALTDQERQNAIKRGQEVMQMRESLTPGSQLNRSVAASLGLAANAIGHPEMAPDPNTYIDPHHRELLVGTMRTVAEREGKMEELKTRLKEAGIQAGANRELAKQKEEDIKEYRKEEIRVRDEANRIREEQRTKEQKDISDRTRLNMEGATEMEEAAGEMEKLASKTGVGAALTRGNVSNNQYNQAVAKAAQAEAKAVHGGPAQAAASEFEKQYPSAVTGSKEAILLMAKGLRERAAKRKASLNAAFPNKTSPFPEAVNAHGVPPQQQGGQAGLQTQSPDMSAKVEVVNKATGQRGMITPPFDPAKYERVRQP